MGTNKKSKCLLHNNMGYIVPIKTQIETQNGEAKITINLNLNITLDSNGEMSIKTDVKEDKSTKKEKAYFEKPDLEDNQEIINFGEQV